MVNADDQETAPGELLLSVRPTEVASLVEALRRAQAGADALRAMLADIGIPCGDHDVVATVDARGEPRVCVIVRDATDRKRFTDALSALIRDHDGCTKRAPRSPASDDAPTLRDLHK